jgi:hypothetical protein
METPKNCTPSLRREKRQHGSSVLPTVRNFLFSSHASPVFPTGGSEAVKPGGMKPRWQKPTPPSTHKRQPFGRHTTSRRAKQKKAETRLKFTRRELEEARAVVGVFVNKKIGIGTFYTVDLYAFFQADVSGVVSLSELQSALARNNVYCSMPFLKRLHRRVMLVDQSDSAGQPYIFDCKRLIKLINQLDQEIPEWGDQEENDDDRCDSASRSIRRTGAVSPEGPSRTLARSSPLPTARHSPVPHAAIAKTEEESHQLAKEYNQILLELAAKAATLQSIEDEHHTLVYAERELQAQKDMEARKQALGREIERVAINIKQARAYTSVITHMLKRLDALKQSDENQNKHARHRLKMYNDTNALSQLEKAQAAAKHVQRAVKLRRSKLADDMEEQTSRLRERLGIVVDLLTVKKMRDVAKARRKDINNGNYEDVELDRRRRRYSEELAEYAALEERFKPTKNNIDRLHSIAGTLALDDLVFKFINLPNKLLATKDTLEKTKDRLQALHIEEARVQQLFLDTCIYEHGNMDKGVKAEDDLGLHGGQEFDTTIHRLTASTEAATKRSQSHVENYKAQRALLANVIERVKTMMFQCGINTNAVDRGLEAIAGEDMYLDEMPKVAMAISTGMDQCARRLSAIAASVVNINKGLEIAPLTQEVLETIPSSPIAQRQSLADAAVQRQETEAAIQAKVKSLGMETVTVPMSTTQVVPLRTIRQEFTAQFRGLGRSEQQQPRLSAPRVREQTVFGAENITNALLGCEPFDIMNANPPLGANVRVAAFNSSQSEQQQRVLRSGAMDLVSSMTNILKQFKLSPKTFFRELDVDRSNSITKVELWEGLKPYGIQWSHAEFSLVFERFNSDGDDGLDEDEFLRVFDRDHAMHVLGKSSEVVQVDDGVSLQKGSHKPLHDKLVGTQNQADENEENNGTGNKKFKAVAYLHRDEVKSRSIRRTNMMLKSLGVGPRAGVE